jgi:hypothetical protein
MHPDTYQKYLTERSKAAMRAKAERGVFPGCAPLGYGNAEVEGEKVIVPDPETAPKVRRLFELAAGKRMSLRKLAAEAEEMGLRSRNGKPLSAPALRLMLTNPFYVGMVRYGGTERTGLHDPIVSGAEFDRAAAALASRSKRRG